MCPMFIAALFIIAKIKQDKCASADECIKNCDIYIAEYYSAIKKNEILPFATTWIDLESMLSEMSEKDKYTVITYIRI